MADCGRREPKLTVVKYRKLGVDRWTEGMPLFRLGGEKIFRKDLGLDYTAPEMFAGSIFDWNLLLRTKYSLKCVTPMVCAAKQSRR